MKKVKVAQIGTSRYSHGSQIWRVMLGHPEVFEVVGYAFPENEREKFPNEMRHFDKSLEMTVEDILENPEIEAVVVETEEIYLTKYAIMVAEAGKHLHMEKPGGTDLSEFRRLVGILESKKLTFSLGYMFRFNPAVRKTVERIEKGELGRIYAVEAQMNCFHDPVWRDWLNAFPGGIMFFLGCHLIDLIYRIKGEPLEVMALNCSTGFDGVSANDYGMAVLKYKDGISFAKTCDTEHAGGDRRQLVVHGEHATVEIHPIEKDCPGGMVAVVREGVGHSSTSYETELFLRFDDMMINFAMMVRGRDNPYTYDYELKLYELILKACGKDV